MTSPIRSLIPGLIVLVALTGCQTRTYYANRTPEQAERDHKYATCLAYVGTFYTQYPSQQYALINLCAEDPDRALAMTPSRPQGPVPVVIVGQQ